MKKVMIVALVPALLGSAAVRPYYASKPEMIARSTAIAVVEVTDVSPARARGASWTYSQVAEATVIETVTGTLPGRIRIYAQENFICARIDFRPGRYLVFLREDGGLLAGSNWYLSARPVESGMVEWYANDTDRGDHPSRIHLTWNPLPDVLHEIRTRVRAGE